MKVLRKLLFEYITVIVYAILAIFVEVSGAYTTDGTFYITDPRYMATFIGIAVSILVLIRKQKARIITASILLYVHMIINMIFILVFEMTEQWFDLSMLSLRGDAMGILENLPINFWYVFTWFFIITTYLVFGLKGIDYLEPWLDSQKSSQKRWVKPVLFSTSGCLIVLFLILNVLTGYAINGDLKIDVYDELIHSNVSSLYNQYGATNNFVNEIYRKGIFYDDKKLPSEEIEGYLYGQGYYDGSNSGTLHGISSDNNVVTILGETLEWYSFIGADEEGYMQIGPDSNDSHDKIYLKNNSGIKPEKMRELYPNLWKMYESSMVMTNYHAREKTDISESYSILGTYPIDAFIHYDYASNVKLQSAPNVIRDYYNQKGESYSAQYFHNGYENFYNRKKAIPGFGFDTYKLTDQMKYNQYYNDYGARGERNFDSQMIDACADEMFPKNKKFYTYITTITMHGLYQRQRDNLTDQGYYDKLYEASYDEETGKHTLPLIEDAEDLELSLYTYLAAAMETDKMLGKLFAELDERGLTDSTTVVIFGDHQAYYEGLSNYCKGIYSADKAIDDGIDYNDLYRVPCMVYDTKLYNALTNNGTNPNGRFNDRFSSSCDIPLTIFDLLGINYYEGLYYGHSMLDNVQESLIYSRAYGYFLSEYAYFKNINNFKYINPKVLNIYSTYDEYKDYLDVLGTALTVNIKYVDNLYKTNLFKYESNYYTYKNNMYDINGWDSSKIKKWTS